MDPNVERLLRYINNDPNDKIYNFSLHEIFIYINNILEYTNLKNPQLCDFLLEKLFDYTINKETKILELVAIVVEVSQRYIIHIERGIRLNFITNGEIQKSVLVVSSFKILKSLLMVSE